MRFFKSRRESSLLVNTSGRRNQSPVGFPNTRRCVHLGQAYDGPAVQQAAYNEILDKYLSSEIRYRFACYADDITAGANTLEELFVMFKALSTKVEYRSRPRRSSLDTCPFSSTTIISLKTKPRSSLRTYVPSDRWHPPQT